MTALTDFKPVLIYTKERSKFHSIGTTSNIEEMSVNGLTRLYAFDMLIKMSDDISTFQSFKYKG